MGIAKQMGKMPSNDPDNPSFHAEGSTCASSATGVPACATSCSPASSCARVECDGAEVDGCFADGYGFERLDGYEKEPTSTLAPVAFADIIRGDRQEEMIRNATLMAAVGVCAVMSAILAKNTDGMVLIAAIVILSAATIACVLSIVTKHAARPMEIAGPSSSGERSARGDLLDGEDGTLVSGGEGDDEFKVQEIAGIADMRTSEAIQLITISEGLRNYLGDASYRFELQESDGWYEEKRELNALFDMADRQTSTRRALIQNIAHEIKTPLTSLKLIAEGIEDGIFTSGDEYTRDTINANVERIDATVRMMTEYVRDGSPREMSVIVGDAWAGIMAAHARAKAMARRRPEVDVRLSLDPDLGFGADLESDGSEQSARRSLPVRISSDSLRRVLESLVENSFEHARDLSIIVISVKGGSFGGGNFDGSGEGVSQSQRLSASAVCITVEDDGTGMEASMAPKMTDPFWKADESHTTGSTAPDEADDKAASPGLGLSIAKSMIEASGGRLDVSCSGSGTCVSVRVPRADGACDCDGAREDAMNEMPGKDDRVDDLEAGGEADDKRHAASSAFSGSRDALTECGIDPSLHAAFIACGAQFDGGEVLIG